MTPMGTGKIEATAKWVAIVDGLAGAGIRDYQAFNSLGWSGRCGICDAMAEIHGRLFHSVSRCVGCPLKGPPGTTCHPSWDAIERITDKLVWNDQGSFGRVRRHLLKHAETILAAIKDIDINKEYAA